MCFVRNYSYDFDDLGLSPSDVLEVYLDMLCKELKDQIVGMQARTSDSLGTTRISDPKLVVAGGDIKDSQLLKTAFSLLNIHAQPNGIVNGTKTL